MNSTTSHIKDLLSRTNGKLLKKLVLFGDIKDVLEKNLGIPVTKNSFYLKNTTLYIKLHPVIKNELVLKKESILKEIELRCGKGFVQTIQ